VTAWWSELDNPERLEADLARHGVPTDIVVLNGQECLDDPYGAVGPNELAEVKANGRLFTDIDAETGGPSIPGSLFTIDPRRFEPGEVLLLRLHGYGRVVQATLVDGPVPPCTVVDRPEA
jgi:hypothetical protein